MRRSSWGIVAAILSVVLLLSGLYVAATYNSDFGRLQVRTISIEDSGKLLSGLIYVPNAATIENPCPAVVVAHGISESKDMMSNIGLELAKRQFVVICLDLIGHGQSDGTVEEGNSEIDFGVSAAVKYLQTLPYVNSSEIELVGHSLGGGAVRAVAIENKNIFATVLIAGGLGAQVQSPDYGVFNATFPKNLLIIVGKYDVLFNLTELETSELPSAFNCSNPVIPDITYGSFEFGTARRLVEPSTTHLFEPIDSETVAEIVNWTANTLKLNRNAEIDSSINLSYPEREIALVLALVGSIGISLISVYPISKLLPKPSYETGKSEIKAKSQSRVYLTWFLLNLVLFFPMILVGYAISFPPLLFGASIAWWVLVTGLIGILLFAKNMPKLWATKPNLRETIFSSFSISGTVVAIVAFLILFCLSSGIQVFSKLDLRILAPILQEITQLRRALAFAVFIPFFFAYFLAEAFYLHLSKNSHASSMNKVEKTTEWAKVVFVKISPFLSVIAVQYLPKLILGIWVLPSALGFVAEFFWLIIPIFIITTTCSWWFKDKTGGIWAGTFFNTLMLAWIASVVFPF